MTDKISLLARVLLLGTLVVLIFVAAAQKQIHPATGAGGPIVIAVVADGYTAAQQQDFNQDAENFFQYGLLADPDYYEAKAGDFTIVTFFEAVSAAQTSNYEFTIGGATTDNCVVQGGGSTLSKLRTLVAAANPAQIVVIGNHPYNFGCTNGDWTYVALDAIGTDVLQHEFGHVFARLYDEWGAGTHATPADIALILAAKKNCWANSATPWWSYADAVNVPGCALFDNLIRPYQRCRMGATHHEQFCKVCRGLMDVALSDLTGVPITTGGTAPEAALAPVPTFRIMNAAYVQPAKPAATHTPALPRPIRKQVFQLIVNVNPGGKEAADRVSAKRGAFAAEAYYQPDYRLAGAEYVYEFTVNGAVHEIGVIPSHKFVSRSYRGGAQQHQVSRPHPIDITVKAPDLTRARVDTEKVELRIYHLPLTVSSDVVILDKEAWQKVKAQAREIGMVPVDLMRNAIKAL
jgi:hypothetical protein